jgi:serine/threonine protein kinase
MASEEQLNQWIYRLTSAGLPEVPPLVGDRLDQITSFSQFLDLLVERKVLTPWQVEELRKGRNQFLVGKYRLLAELGRGGMAQVFLAEHVTMERRVAIKLISSKLPQAAMERFLAEVRAIAALDHPNIVHAYNVDSDGGQYYLVMEFVEGKTLERIVHESGPLAWKQAVEIARQTAQGLDCAHAKGIIHCDLKPANLIVNTEGIVKILDLGLARLVGRDQQVSSTKSEESPQVLGTVDYMAPELALDPDHVDHRADIYSLGCILYFALTGNPPFPDGTLAERILRHQMTPPPDPRRKRSDIPHRLAEVVIRSLAKRPAARFQTAMEMAAALDQCLLESPSSIGLVRARPLSDEAVPDRAKTGKVEADFTIKTASQSSESDMSSVAASRVAACATGGLEGKQKSGKIQDEFEIKRKRRRWMWYAAAAVTVATSALLVLPVLWNRLGGNDGRSRQERKEEGTPGHAGKKPASLSRPEDDPEAFREKLEEWMQSQMGPKTPKESRK